MSNPWSISQARRVADAAAFHEPNKDVAAAVAEFFGSGGPIRSSLTAATQSVANFGQTISGTNSSLLGKIDDKVYKALKFQYANLYVATGAGLVTSGISGVTNSITGAIGQASQAITDNLKPVSGFMGATLYSLTNMMKDPLGAITDLPNALGPILDAISPTLRAKFIGTYKNFNLGKIFEIPGNILGSIQSLVGFVDSILAIPIQLLSDVYAALMEIMGAISDAINRIFDFIQQLLINIIDELFPGLTDFLTQLSIFAGQIGAIASIFSGFNKITAFTNNIINFSNSLNGIIQNPLDFAFSFMPPSFNQGLYLIQNPQQIVNGLLAQVPEVGNIIGQFSSITGFGLNGNMGYGLQATLQGLQGGVLASILNGFATQFSILAPLFTGGLNQPQPEQGQNSTVPLPTSNGPTYNKGVAGGNIVQTTPNQPNPSINNPVPPAGATSGSAGGTGSQSGSAATTSNNSGLRVQVDSDSGEAWIVDSAGQIVRSANATEEATGVVQ